MKDLPIGESAFTIEVLKHAQLELYFCRLRVWGIDDKFWQSPSFDTEAAAYEAAYSMTRVLEKDLADVGITVNTVETDLREGSRDLH